MVRRQVTIDGNEAAAWVAHRLAEVIAIYPITPSSAMGEWADEWAAEGIPNVWGTVPTVIEMQSEGGAAGTLHGAIQAGSLTTTFTASQGLLLMLPNMYKIAGELTPTVIHVSARTLATHALSIFGDHSDVMAARMTGFALLASGNVQEVMDNAVISHAATLEARIPFLHFFDGFRTSHEVNKIEQVTEDDVRLMISDEAVLEHRARALTPDRPVLRGSAQNPDVFFQAREAANPHYDACPAIVQRVMDRFAHVVGRQYHLFDYHGCEDADRVLVVMGSGADTAHETVDHLVAQGEKVGIVKVRLYRPFDVTAFVSALPMTTRHIAVLDRTKEPGAIGEPLYLDVVAALAESAADGNARFKQMPRVIGGRYGLSSKEFTPAMVKAVFDELKREKPKRHFSVGIMDDVTKLSLDYDPTFVTESTDGVRAVFYGLGSDGTVSANKNSIKIIGDETDQYAQGYFVYDSKKSGSMTVSHLRFGKDPIRSAYLVQQAEFIACHTEAFLSRMNVLEKAQKGTVFLLNTSVPPDQAFASLPVEMQRRMIEMGMKFFVIDGSRVARDIGLGGRINTIMQTCFFVISGVLPREQAIANIKRAISKAYGAKGEAVVVRNFEAVDKALENLHEVALPEAVPESAAPVVARTEINGKPEFVLRVTMPMIEGKGDDLPVSAMPTDGTFPTNTARWEKRSIAHEVPIWDPDVCIQCNQCALVCPHAAIRAKVYDGEDLKGAPESFLTAEARGGEFKGLQYTIQVAPEDCTGCGICVEVCPAKNKQETRRKAINMESLNDVVQRERERYHFFLDIPDFDRSRFKRDSVKGSQFMLPLFEYSGACSGCGETPYVKLVSQLFGDRAMIANATGCSSIYGGNLPTTPWAVDADGRGPAWSNSLFEDNAEFGLGFRLSLDKQREMAVRLLHELADELGEQVVRELTEADQSDEAGIALQRHRVAELREKLAGIRSPEALHLRSVADALCVRSVWIMGGDGWAYDIGFGGLDHVLASGHNVNVLVLDTEVYSNTGGQMSKATPCGAVAKFAAAGKPGNKKDLGRMVMGYGNVYIATIAMGANPNQTVKAIVEAESYDGPSLIIAYSHCIAHGINMTKGMEQQQLAVDAAHWPLYRYDPRRAAEGHNPLVLDSKPPRIPLSKYVETENRYRMLARSRPNRWQELLAHAQTHASTTYKALQELAGKG